MFQQIVGCVNLSIPIITLFYFAPYLLHNIIACIVASVALGIYIWYLNYLQHNNLQKNLRYSPTGTHKDLFENIIRSCDVNPETISIKYAYTEQQIAMALGSTIIIDPTTCTICHDDPQATSVMNVFTQLYEPRLNSLAQHRQVWQRQNLTPDIQMFIFKHEIGHIVDNYSYKKLWIIFGIGSLATLSGIITAKLVMNHVGGFTAIVTGILAGAIADLLLTYGSNYFFKVAKERKADIFAAQHSTAEEITQTAHFFAQEHDIIERYKDPKNLWFRLPITILSGHPNGKTRQAYLLELARSK